jgi:hypothetical protein
MAKKDLASGGRGRGAPASAWCPARLPTATRRCSVPFHSHMPGRTENRAPKCHAPHVSALPPRQQCMAHEFGRGSSSSPRRAGRVHSTRGRRCRRPGKRTARRRRLLGNLEPAGLAPAATTPGVDAASPRITPRPSSFPVKRMRNCGRPGRAVLPRSERPVSGDSTHTGAWPGRR